MGRVVVRVPENYKHPRNIRGRYMQIFPWSYEEAVKEWREECDTSDPQPDPDDYIHWDRRNEKEAPWWQVWQNTGEGSPVTPPFATPEELIEHLVNYGQDYEDGFGWQDSFTREDAEEFVRDGGYLPSIIMLSAER